MSHAQQLAARIVVEERAAGFLRLSLPAELATPAAAGAIESGMIGCAGLRSAQLEAAARQLVLRFDAAVVSAAAVARHLFSLLDALPAEAPPAAASGLQPWLDRLRDTLLPPGEVAPDSLRARLQPVLESALTEKAMTNFFNDILAFYLIKVHWDLITKRWLQNPVAHANAWLAVFYLVFLLIRYRKT